MVASTAFATRSGWSVCNGIPWSVCPGIGGQLAPESGGLVHQNLHSHLLIGNKKNVITSIKMMIPTKTLFENIDSQTVLV